MRISDWSSDVCSSDLAAELRHAEIGTLADHLRAQPLRVDAQRVVGPVADVEMAFRRGLHVGAYAAEPQQLDFRLQQALEDRKSVVEGKSVSVRVDLGGRRIIKTNKKQEYKTEHKTN